MTDQQPSWPFNLIDPSRAVHFAMEPDCPYNNPRSCPTESSAVAAIIAYKAWASVHPQLAPRRRLTELEHSRAWHAIDGLEWQAFPDADTVLNAVLGALSIDPPARDCPSCEVGIEHDVHCPTPESHNWGCGCPTDQRPAAEAAEGAGA
ncbi:hypothetical protein AB0M92_18860 [Streptomyces sp. NPDC051582]|uniref:hypothetical protein n=1 Tax=Streptomyces sp. NPDC051582 TaxID=3155167 RepID=UPI0034174AE2